jgi:hypothetical protein
MLIMWVVFPGMTDICGTVVDHWAMWFLYYYFYVQKKFNLVYVQVVGFLISTKKKMAKVNFVKIV